MYLCNLSKRFLLLRYTTNDRRKLKMSTKQKLRKIEDEEDLHYVRSRSMFCDVFKADREKSKLYMVLSYDSHYSTSFYSLW
jgi:hypothetical protein